MRGASAVTITLKICIRIPEPSQSFTYLSRPPPVEPNKHLARHPPTLSTPSFQDPVCLIIVRISRLDLSTRAVNPGLSWALASLGVGMHKAEAVRIFTVADLGCLFGRPRLGFRRVGSSDFDGGEGGVCGAPRLEVQSFRGGRSWDDSAPH